MKLLVFFFSAILGFFLNCANTGYGPEGLLYTNTKISLSATEIGSEKEGRACSYSILGLLAWGDASSGAAMRNGLLSQIRVLEREGKSYLGVYSEACTVVKGI